VAQDLQSHRITALIDGSGIPVGRPGFERGPREVARPLRFCAPLVMVRDPGHLRLDRIRTERWAGRQHGGSSITFGGADSSSGRF
jgi:hypothetical protein